jgi:hypothetical protein
MSILAVAVDYDNTISIDSAVFKKYLPPLAHSLTLELIVTTSRKGSQSDIEEFARAGLIGNDAWVDGVVWCGSQWKVDACESAGYEVVFWIDDQPEGCKRGGILWARIVGGYKWLKQKIFGK